MLSVLTDKGVAALGAFILIAGLSLILLLGVATFVSDLRNTDSDEPQYWYQDPSRYEQREFFGMCYTDMVVIEGWRPDRAEDFCNAMWWEHQ